MLIYDLGKEVINPVVGLHLDNKLIPMNSRGVVIDIDCPSDTTTIQWAVEGKIIRTNIPCKLYDQLMEAKMLDNVKDHIEIPPSKFNIGDLVECRYDERGIINRKKYDSLNNKWTYRLVRIEGILDTDSDIRYTEEDEEDLTEAAVVSGTASIYQKDVGDIEYTVTITRKTE